MKNVILAICSVTMMIIAACAIPAHAQWANVQLYGGGRPPPPTEPSVVIPASHAAAPKIELPKPVVQRIIVRRPHSVQSGPVKMPPAEVLVMMVRAALSGVNQANFTENYSVLRGMTTPALQARVSAAQLGKAFAGLRKQNLDLSPALVMAPQFTTPPTLTPGRVLKLKGIFPSRPLRINFAIDYMPIDGFWMIDEMSVSASPADAPVTVATAAPAPKAAPAQAAALAPKAMPAPKALPVVLPAPAPMARPARPSLTTASASADSFPGFLPTRQFVPVKYPVDYRLAFVPAGRPAQVNTQTNAKAVGAARNRQGSAVYVQLTSQRSEAEAKAAFDALRAKYPAILGDRRAVIRRADLGNKGVYYRAQIGPVSAAQADRQCNDLKDVGGQCFVQYN